MSDFLIETLTQLKTPWEEWPPEAKRRKRELDVIFKAGQLKNRLPVDTLDKLDALKQRLYKNRWARFSHR